MSSCQNCGRQLSGGEQFCPSCGTRVEQRPTPQSGLAERVLGVVLFGGYYKDICFTDRRIIQFETMGDRWKFFLKAAKPLPLVVDTDSKIEDVTPFIKSEIPIGQVRQVDLKDHSRFGRGHIKVLKATGETIELARIDLDVTKEMFGQMVKLLRGAYPQVAVVES